MSAESESFLEGLAAYLKNNGEVFERATKVTIEAWPKPVISNRKIPRYKFRLITVRE